MRCMACDQRDARTECGGLLCQDCEEAGAAPRPLTSWEEFDRVCEYIGVSFDQVIGAALPSGT